MIKRCWVQDFQPRKAYGQIGDIDYANSPTLAIEVDEALFRLARDSIRYQQFEGTHFWGERNGIVSFFYHSGTPQRQEGFGGRHFTLPMEDDSVVTLIGPWSSRAGVMNAHFPPCLDVVIKFPEQQTGIAGAVTLEFARAAASSAFVPPPGLSKYTQLVFLKIDDIGEIVYTPALIKDTYNKTGGGRVYAEVKS